MNPFKLVRESFVSAFKLERQTAATAKAFSPVDQMLADLRAKEDAAFLGALGEDGPPAGASWATSSSDIAVDIRKPMREIGSWELGNFVDAMRDTMAQFGASPEKGHIIIVEETLVPKRIRENLPPWVWPQFLDPERGNGAYVIKPRDDVFWLPVLAEL